MDASEMYDAVVIGAGPPTAFMQFVGIPRALAWATLDALRAGREKLSRTEVVEIVQGLEPRGG